MPKKSDAQSNRSKEWMMSSLINLMKRKEYSRISISEIADEAGLDRRTFYRHFSSKEDIICCYISNISKDYEKLLLSHKDFKTKSVLQSFMSICVQEKELLLLLYKNNLLPLLLYEFENIFLNFHMKYTNIDEPYDFINLEYTLSYHIGGFWNILNKWLSEGASKTPEEITLILIDNLPESI